MASLWKHPKSKYWTACYTNKDVKRVKHSTKQTERKKAQAIAIEWERVEQQARQGTISTLQIQKVLNDLVEKTTGDTILTPSVEKYLRDWLVNVEAKNSEATAKRYGRTVNFFLKSLKDKAKPPMPYTLQRFMRRFRGSSGAYPERYMSGRSDHAQRRTKGQTGCSFQCCLLPAWKNNMANRERMSCKYDRCH